MNSTFKVVFNKARGALMVVNEVTSSVQAKGTKTVVATAVAAMIAGVAGTAMAAEKDAAYVEDGVTITISGTEVSSDGIIYAAEVPTGETERAKWTLTGNTKDTFKADGTSIVYLRNGNLVITGVADKTGDNGTPISGADANQTIDELNTSGAASVSVTGVNKHGASLTVTKTVTVTTGKTLDLNLTSYDAVSDGTAGAASVDFKVGATLDAGKLYVAHAGDTADTRVKGTSKIQSSTGALTFGTAPVFVGEGENREPTANKGTVYTIETEALTTSEISGKTGVTFNQANITNAGDMAVKSANGDVTYKYGTLNNTGNLTITGKNIFLGDALANGTGIAIVNEGTIDASGQTATNLNADYTATTGKLYLKGSSIGINGNVTADTVKIGTKETKEKNQIVLDGETTVADKKKLTVGDTLTLANNLAVNGELEAAKVVTNGTSSVTVVGTADLGEVTVGTKESSAAQNLTVNNSNTTKTVAISALSINNGSATSQVTLEGQKFTVDSLNNTKGTLAITGQEVKLTAEGTSTVEVGGTVTVGADSSLVVAAGHALTNKGTLGNADNGTLEVYGTVTNIYSDSVATEKGAIQVKTVNVNDGGVLATNLAKLTAVTNIKTGGKIQTALDADIVAGGEKDALSIVKTYNLDGQFVDATGAEITSYLVGNSGALTVTGEREWTNVSVASGGSVVFDDAEASVALLKAVSGASVEIGKTESATLTVAKFETEIAKVKVTDGTLVTSLAAMDKQLKTDGTEVEAVTTLTGAKFAGADLGQHGVLKLTDLDGKTLTTAGVTSVKTTVGNPTNGLIDLGNATITGVISNGVVSADQYNNVLGIATDALAEATVEGVSSVTAAGKFGKFAKVTENLTIDGADLTLTGTGDLVTKTDSTKQVPADVKLTKGAVLTTTGEGASLKSVTLSGSSDPDKVGDLVVAAGDLTLNGTSSVTNLGVAGTLTVAKNPTAGAAAYDLTVAKKADISGKVVAEYGTVTVGADSVISGEGTTVKNLAAASGLAVTGSAIVTDTLTTGVYTPAGADPSTDPATDYAVHVGNDKNAGSLSVKKLAAGQIFADPAWDQEGHSVVAVETLDAGAGVLAGRNSVVSVGTTDVTAGDKALAASGFTLGKTKASDKQYSENTFTVNSVVYAEGTQIAGNVQANANSTFTGVATDVHIATNSMLAIDAAKVDTTGEKSVFMKQVAFGDGAVLFIDNLKNSDKIKLSNAGVDVAPGGEVVQVIDGNVLRELAYNRETKLLTVDMDSKTALANAGFDGAGLDAVYGMYEEGKNVDNNSASAQFNKWLYTTNAFNTYVEDGERDINVKLINQVANEVAALGATAGVQTVTLDAVNMMADTAAARTSILNQKAEGAQVWAEVNGGSFEAKKLFNGAGYSSDIWAGSIGVDYTAACGGTLGAALTIGTADTDSKNTGVVSSTDSDLVGFTLYANKTFNDVLNVAVDLGYLQASNEVSANGYAHSWKFDQDTDAFTFGVRGEVLTKVGGVNIVPHAGLRWTRISTDDFEAGYTTDVASMNVFQLPLGVTVSGEFEAADWTIAPKFDLSVVPAFGDKDAELTLGIAGVSATDDLAVRVVDSNPVQATLGVSATTGAWAFGLNYKLGVGSDSRMNNTFNANVRYAF